MGGGKVVKLYINGVEKHYIRLHYHKSHPNPDPDTFDITMDEKETVDIVSFQTVEIKKDDVTEFYGFVEEITPDEEAENGTDVKVTGRCWKLLSWKKFNERFQESREVGPIDDEGNTESGFFGSVNPVELFKFALRCPMSLHPKGRVRHKIGWGIPSDFWRCCANETAEGRYPDWVGLRYIGLAWRGYGTVDTINEDVLPVNNFTDESGGVYDAVWTKIGVSPYLDADDYANNYIRSPYTYGFPNGFIGDFEFTDINPARTGIFRVMLGVKYHMIDNLNRAVFNIYDGIEWHFWDWYLDFTREWVTVEYDVTAILDTMAKINAAKVRFARNQIYAGNIEIDYCYLRVFSGTSAATDTQQSGDWFIIKLGDVYDDVTAILIESRNNPSMYPENYNIQFTSSMSDCCDPSFPEAAWEDFDDGGNPISVTSNSFRDVLHSWKPEDDVAAIRIKLTDDADRPWEISQIYIWQSDDLKYRLYDEES